MNTVYYIEYRDIKMRRSGLGALRSPSKQHLISDRLPGTNATRPGMNAIGHKRPGGLNLGRMLPTTK